MAKGGSSVTCAKCGAEFEGKFCPQCGAPAPGEAAAGGGGGAGSTPPPNTAPPAQAAAASGGLSDNAAATLCYVFILAIVFLLIAPYNSNKTVRFHAFQAIFLWIAMVVVYIALGFLTIMLPWWMTSMLGMLLQLGFFILWIFMLIKTYQGSKVVLPVIGPIAEKQA